MTSLCIHTLSLVLTFGELLHNHNDTLVTPSQELSDLSAWFKPVYMYDSVNKGCHHVLTPYCTSILCGLIVNNKLLKLHIFKFIYNTARIHEHGLYTYSFYNSNHYST